MKIDKENSMLIDVQYVKTNKKNNTPDCLYIIWKNMDTGEKYMQSILEPPVEIYFEKPEFRDHLYNKNYAPLKTLDKKVVKHKDIIFAIANDMGDVGKQKLANCFQTQNYQGLKEFLIYPYVYGADYDVRVWYRYKWMESFDNSRPKILTKGFLDIETDIMEADGFPNPAFDPIDMVTFIDASHKHSYTFTLVGRECKPKNMDNMTYEERVKELERRELYENRHRQEEYYIEHPDELMREIHEAFDESYPDMEYSFYFYKDERKMLVHLFQLINTLKLDFIEIWNIAFDIPYILDRMEALGLDPKEVICHPDFLIKQCYFKKDTINFAIKNKSDFFFVSSYTIFTDQMVNYAAIRKGQSELRSNKLTYIAQREIGDEKLDYSEEGNLKVLGYKNWLKYLLYNIKDVLLQKGIEERTSDLDTYYVTSYQNITPYESEFKQTVKLRNVQYLFYLRNGNVPGENVNGFMYNYESKESDDDEENSNEKFEGALVGNPALIDNFGAELFGKPTNNIFLYSIDFDMSAFYPSTIAAMNIDPSTLIFKMIMDSQQYDVRGGKLPFNGITDVQLVKENTDSFSGDIAKEVMDNFQTRDYVSTAHKWMNLPSVADVYAEMVKRLG